MIHAGRSPPMIRDGGRGASAWIAYHGDPFGGAREPLPFFAVLVLESVVLGEADACVGVEVVRVGRERRAVSCHSVQIVSIKMDHDEHKITKWQRRRYDVRVHDVRSERCRSRQAQPGTKLAPEMPQPIIAYLGAHYKHKH
jgi:hypothetical protein